jgi:hypothetical protein
MPDLEIQMPSVAIDTPFFLIFGDVSSSFGTASAFEDVIRRIGLRPKAVKHGDAAPDQYHFRIELGDLQAEISLHTSGGLTDSDAIIVKTSSHAPVDHPDKDAGPPVAGTLDFLNGAPFVRLSPAVHNGGAGMRTIDMLRMLCQIAYQCCIVLHPSHVFWSPAQIWSDASQFAEAVEDMFTTGLPPINQMVAFVASHGADGAYETSQSLVSKGLSLFCGQEILAAIPQGFDSASVSRRMKQLAADMMINGPILEQRSVPGMKAGERIHLLPSLYGRNQEGVVRMTLQSG